MIQVPRWQRVLPRACDGCVQAMSIRFAERKALDTTGVLLACSHAVFSQHRQQRLSNVVG